MASGERGRVGELIARKHLEKNGYEILCMNYRKRCGEIDIIALNDNTIVFVEVKLRAGTRFGMPSEAVDSRKIAKFSQTAAMFISENEAYADRYCRYDIIELVGRDTVSINHIEGAFEAPEGY